jgi:hypothetical protein
MMGDQEPRDTKRYAIEQLLGNESLTSDLVDEAAKLLLDWGATQLDAASQPAEELSRTDLDARLSRLRCLMRHVNRRAGQASADQQAERVRRILARLDDGEDVDVEGSAQ